MGFEPIFSYSGLLVPLTGFGIDSRDDPLLCDLACNAPRPSSSPGSTSWPEMSARSPIASFACWQGVAIRAGTRTAFASSTRPVMGASRALLSDHSMTSLPPSSVARDSDFAVSGTARRTVWITEMIWMTVTLVATASSRIVGPSALLYLPENTAVASMMMRVVSKILSGRSD